MTTSSHYQDLPGEAIIALQKGNKIEAIKFVRIAFNVGLKDAKEIVEQYIENNPSVKTQMNAANKESAQGALKWLILFGAIAAIVYYFFSHAN